MLKKKVQSFNRNKIELKLKSLSANEWQSFTNCCIK